MLLNSMVDMRNRARRRGSSRQWLIGVRPRITPHSQAKGLVERSGRGGGGSHLSPRFLGGSEPVSEWRAEWVETLFLRKSPKVPARL